MHPQPHRHHNHHHQHHQQQQQTTTNATSLPICAARSTFLQAFNTHDCVVLVGETGSGKTTQIPQFILDQDIEQQRTHSNGSRTSREHQRKDAPTIAITQPRRVAAITVARRVAHERRVDLGAQVGYCVRFDDCSSVKHTRIRYVTDGMLLRELALDQTLARYSVVILDEAHERTLHTDVLLALLKALQGKRKQARSSLPPLKLVIMSATLQAERFVDYLCKQPEGEKGEQNRLQQQQEQQGGSQKTEKATCALLKVPGKMYPVDIMFTHEAEADYLDAAVITVLQIHLDDAPALREEQKAAAAAGGAADAAGGVSGNNDGAETKRKGPEMANRGRDILVFLTGQEEIETAKNLLLTRLQAARQSASTEPVAAVIPPLHVCVMYAALSADAQLRVFERAPPGSRKVILATNIAETSITIGGVRFVVDCGLVKMRRFHAASGLDCLSVTETSKAEAFQRSGRAGRDQAGMCYRLYPEASFATMRQAPVPEILRCNLAACVLQLKAIGVSDIFAIDFLDAPPKRAFRVALEQLYRLGALEDTGKLSETGKRMIPLPLDPRFSRCLIAAGSQSEHFDCLEEMLSIVALLSSDSVFVAPRSNARADSRARQRTSTFARRRLASVYGDHLTLLNVWREYNQVPKSGRAAWCRDSFLNYKALKHAALIREQLCRVCRGRIPGRSLAMSSCGANLDAVRKCLVVGFFLNVAQLQADGSYRNCMDQRIVYLHPSSTLFYGAGGVRKPACVVYNELVMTSKRYMRGVSEIDPAWLEELAPFLYKAAAASQEYEPNGLAHASSSAARGHVIGGRSGVVDRGAGTFAPLASAASRRGERLTRPAVDQLAGNASVSIGVNNNVNGALTKTQGGWQQSRKRLRRA